MPVPWLRILDVVIGVTDLARSRKIRQAAAQSEEAEAQQQSLEAVARAGGVPGSPGGPGSLEARLAGVVVAALKEAFDRDTRRLELERAHVEAERERAERALRLELRRQTGDREIGRLRLLAALAVASWLGTLFLTVFLRRLSGAGGESAVGARIALGGGWLLLLLAFALAFSAQSQVARSLDRDTDPIESGIAGDLAVWFLVAGLALAGLAVLVA